jgi:hypothetical protein
MLTKTILAIFTVMSVLLFGCSAGLVRTDQGERNSFEQNQQWRSALDVRPGRLLNRGR